MAPRYSETVGIAFEMLLEAIDKEIRTAIDEGKRAWEAHNFQLAADTLKQTEMLKEFRERVAGLSKDWEALSRGEQVSTARPPRPAPRRSQPRWPRGERTPQQAYYVPILQALEEMGGHGRMALVLERVNQKLRSCLTPADRTPLPSNPQTQRWRHSAQMARSAMVREGLVRPDSPTGIWEITEKGREYLRQHAAGRSSEET
ncbi:MAG: hypothetical protein C4346_02780 [Chloroflexota bacterium]